MSASAEDRRYEQLLEGQDGAALVARLEEIAAEGSPGAVEVAVDLLDHPQPEVVIAAAQAAARLKAHRAAPSLRALLGPDTPEAVGRAALRALAEIGGEESWRVLEAIVSDPGDPRHRPLVDVLTEVEGHPRIARAVEGVLFSERYPFKGRLLAVLRKHRSPTAEAIFQEFLDEPREELACEAARGLARFPSPANYRRLTDRLQLGPWTAQVACLEALTAIEPHPPARDLAPALGAEHPEVALAALAIVEGAPGADAIAPLAAAAQHSSWKVRARAAEVLGETRDPRVIDDLERLTEDERAAVRAAAYAAAVGITGADPEVWGTRGAADPEPQVRAAAARHLAEAPSSTARAHLLQQLGDKHAEVRAAALDALAQHDLEGLEDKLKPLTRDGDAAVRAAAKARLAYLGAPTDSDQLEEARVLAEAGDEEGARDALRALIGQRPDDPAVVLDLARLTHRLGEAAEAEALLRRFRDAHPQHAGARRLLAEVLLDTGRRAEACEQLRHACAADRSDWRLWTRFGELLLEQRHARAASEAFETALRVDPSHAPAHRGLAEALEAARDLDGAAREWRWCHERDPQDPRPLAGLGRVALEAGDAGAAAAYLARARDLGDESNQVLAGLTEAVDQAGNLEQARVLLEELIARGGASDPQRIALGRLYLRAGDPARALSQARALTANDDATSDSAAEALDLEADALDAMGEVEPALDARVRLAGVAPDHPGARRKYADLLARAGRGAEARQVLTALLEDSPLDLEVRRALIEQEVQARRGNSALRLLQAGIELHRDQPDLPARAARILWRRGELSQALRHALAASDLAPEDGALRALVGDLHREVGSPNAAIEQYEAALEHGHDTPELRLNLGLALASTHKPAQALPHLERAAAGPFGERPDVCLAVGETLWTLRRIARAREWLVRAAADHADPRPRVALAELELDAGDPQEALLHLRALERLAPDHPRRPRLEAAVRRRLGETGVALALLEKALALEPGDPTLVSELAACYLDQERWRELADLFPGSPLLPGEDPVIRTAKVAAHLALGNHAKALSLAARVVELEPDLLLGYALQARAARALDQLDAAERALVAGLAIDPDEPTLLLERARTRLARNWLDAALSDCAAGLQLADRAPEFFLVRAEALVLSGRHEPALEAVANYLLRAPKDPAGHRLRAECMRALGRLEEAAEGLQNAVALDATRPQDHLTLAEIATQRARPEEAVSHLQDYLAISDDRVPALERLAELHEGAGRLEEASEVLRELAQADDGAEAREQLIDLLIRRKDLGAAWPLLERASAFDPDLAGRLAARVLERGDPAIARDLAGFALQLRPADPEALYTSALCQYRLGAYPAAKRALGRLLDRQPAHGGAHFYLGLLHLIDEAPQAALPHLEQAVQADPENLVAYRHLARIELGAGRPEKALGWTKAGAHHVPGDRELLLFQAAAHRALDDDAQAYQAFRAAGRQRADARSHPPAMRLALRLGRPAEARALGEEYLKARPEDSSGRRLLARAAAASGDPARAAEVLDELRTLGDARVEDLRDLARARCATSRWAEAADVASQALQKDPTHADTWVLLGHVETARHRPVDAARAFGEAVKHAPRRADAWRGLGEATLVQSRHREADDAARKAVALAPQDPRAHLLMGQVEQAQGQLRKARAALEQGLAVAGGSEVATPIRLALAEVLRDLGEPGNAKRILQGVGIGAGSEAARQMVRIAYEAEDYAACSHHAKGYLAENAEDPGILEYLGRSLVQLGMDRQAKACLDRHLNLHGVPVDLTVELAHARVHKGQPSEAITMLVEALEKQSRSAALWRAMAEAREARGDAKGSLRALERAFDLDPGDLDTARALGERYAQGHHWEKARALYRDAARAHPYDASLWMGLGAALKARGELDGARQAYQRAAEVDPRRADAQRELGLSLARAGQRARAVEALARAVRLAPDDVAAVHALARAYRDLGDPDLAAVHFERLLAIAEPRSAEAKAARTYLGTQAA